MDSEKNAISCYWIKNETSSKDSDYLNLLYKSWKRNWFDLFEEIGNREQCSSDEFARQDYFLALYLNHELAGSIGFREVDLSLEVGVDDSYMIPWPGEFKSTFSKEKILLMSGFNIAKKFRGRFLRVPSMFLFGTFIMKQFLRSKNLALVTIARNDAGVNKFCEAFGANKVGYSENFHGKECDLMCFEKESVKLFPIKAMEQILGDKEIEDFNEKKEIYKIGA